jgi:hypothetical protein
VVVEKEMYLAWKEAWELPQQKKFAWQVTRQVLQQVSWKKKSVRQPGTRLVTRSASRQRKGLPRQRVEAWQEYYLPRQRWRQVGWRGVGEVFGGEFAGSEGGVTAA